jgi:hypothetical protein
MTASSLLLASLLVSPLLDVLSSVGREYELSLVVILVFVLIASKNNKIKIKIKLIRVKHCYLL